MRSFGRTSYSRTTAARPRTGPRPGRLRERAARRGADPVGRDRDPAPAAPGTPARPLRRQVLPGQVAQVRTARSPGRQDLVGWRRGCLDPAARGQRPRREPPGRGRRGWWLGRRGRAARPGWHGPRGADDHPGRRRALHHHRQHGRALRAPAGRRARRLTGGPGGGRGTAPGGVAGPRRLGGWYGLHRVGRPQPRVRDGWVGPAGWPLDGLDQQLVGGQHRGQGRRRQRRHRQPDDE
jgi:hypothetical protein